MTEQTWELLPQPFIETLTKILPVARRDSVLQTFTVDKPVTFRANTLKIQTNELEQQLHKQNILFQKVAWYPDAFILDKHVKKEVLVESDLHKEGLLYIQSLSSMIPSLILDPKPDELICDLTAAPGSKTTQLAMMMQNTGKIVANDISRARMYKLKANLTTQGVTNTELSFIPGQALWKRYPEYFDKTLVDVPCTLEGRFSTLDPKTYEGWTPKKVKILSRLQQFLLRSAISLTKPGGTIIYSTCTFQPEENEGVVDWLLKKAGKSVSVEEIAVSVGDSQPGITTWNKKTFDPQLKKTMRVLPSETMEGFYVAKLKKLESSLPF